MAEDTNQDQEQQQQAAQDQQQQLSNITLNGKQAAGGMNLNSSLRQVKPGQVTFALNAQVESFDGNGINYQNETANIDCFTITPGYKVHGRHFIPEQDRVVIWSVNPTTGGSEIGVASTLLCTYTPLVNQTCLNFDINHPILKSVHKITNCGTEVYWTDVYNSRRFIDIDNLPYAQSIQGNSQSPCETVTLTTIDCNKLNVQPNFSIPQIVYDSIVDGGNTVEGTYQFAIQYTNYKGDPYTSFYSITNPIPILDPLKVGPDFNYVTGQSIRFKVNNIDTTGIFDYFNIAVIKTINNIASVDLVGTYQITDPTQTIIYTGQSKTGTSLTINDIFEKYPYFDIADDVTTVQDVLLWKGLTTNERISYQLIANQITPQWQTWIIPPSQQGYKNPLNCANLESFMRDENYPIGMVVVLKNGYQSDFFPFIGRAATSTDTEIVSNADSNSNANICETPQGVPRWQVYNTGSVSGFSPEYLANGQGNDCYVGPYQFGEFGYVESTETYPCNDAVWGDLAGQPIRHFRFPDSTITHHHDNQGNIYPIGLRVDTEAIYNAIMTSDLTQDQKDQIAQIKIVRGDRANNKSIVAKGLLYNVGAYTKNNSSYFYPNYPFNDLREDPFIKGKVDLNVGTIIASSYDTNITVGSTGTQLYDALIPANTMVTTGDELLCTYVGNLNGTVVSGNPRVMELFINGNVVFDSGPLAYGAGTVFNLNITVTRTTDSTLTAVSKLTLFGTSSRTYNQTTTLTGVDFTSTLDFSFQGQSVGSAAVDGDITTESETIQYEPAADNVVSTSPYLQGFSTPQSQNRFTFHSPDTSFYQPSLGTQLKLESVEYGTALSHFVQVKDHAKYKFPSLGSYLTALAVGAAIGFASGTYGVSDNVFNGTAAFTAFGVFNDLVYKLIPRRNFAYQFNSVGTYENVAIIPNDNANKIRQVDIGTYLTSGLQGVGDDFVINNYQRESSVFLRTTASVPFPDTYNGVPQDTSRYVAAEVGCDIGFYSNPISSYYGSIKNFIPDQYGQIYSFPTVDTGFVLPLDLTQPYTGTQYQSVFGGDTFINRFALKRKLPFFLDNRVKFPDDSDVFYDEIGNIGSPSFWFSTDVTQGSGGTFNIGSLFGVKVNNFDCRDGSFFYDSGKIYLFAYGIPYFFVESQVNVDYRQAYNSQEGDFFPHVSSAMPDDWLQETFVPIIQDNTYNYNKSFSKQNDENVFTVLPTNFVPGQACISNYPNKAIWSDKQEDPVYYKKNNWLIYRPNNYNDFPLNYGRLIDIEGIENREILARFENRLVSYNTMLTLNTSSPSQFYLGQDLFKSGIPVDFSDTDAGYAGTQHKFFIKTEKGHVAIDAKRGQIILVPPVNPSWGRRQLKDLASEEFGLSQFFCENLEFRILKQFPNYPIDNAFNGIGLHGTYDSKYSRLILTKIDYEVTDPTLTWNSTTNQFFSGTTPVVLGDPNFFCSRSFTLSFSFITGSWVSFHTYLPNYYIPGPSYFFSGINNEASSCWIHNRTYTLFNNFYGEVARYVLEYPFAYKYNDEIVQNVKDYTKVLEYFSNNDYQDFIEIDNIYFNKAILYNGQQCSGLLNLVPKPKGNLAAYIGYPKNNTDSRSILVTKSNNFYNYNSFYDTVVNKQLPFFLRDCSSLSLDRKIVQSNIDYGVRSFKKAPLMAKELKIRHILDNTSNYKLISQFITAPSQQSFK